METERTSMVETLSVRCLIAGGGPAGMMLGFLLARAGVSVAVLEKHADFNRDFRGDTIHPSTLELMYELGLLKEFLEVPHQELRELQGVFNGEKVPIADFSRLPTHCQFIAFMPQWDFLNFVSAQARRYPCFQLHMETKATDLIVENQRVSGVKAQTPRGQLEIRADLVVGADGRDSTVRSVAALEVIESGVPIDVLWMRISKRADDPSQSLGFFQNGKLLVLLDRSDYWQCGYIIPKGGFDPIKTRGLENFHGEIAEMVPFLRERLGELDDWSKIKLLTVQINRLRHWYREGLLCIGDAAHAMSPAGGVGINLAIQDAVAAANILTGPLRKGAVPVNILQRVQTRREWPARLIQLMQVFIHRRIGGRARPATSSLPWIVRLLRDLPILRQIPARLIGIGPRPEHITTEAGAG
jgi:2-polyprenyl-6-methoxyphenol hydroxylase-like FAD-dependent oxidoreductase